MCRAAPSPWDVPSKPEPWDGGGRRVCGPGPRLTGGARTDPAAGDGHAQGSGFLGASLGWDRGKWREVFEEYIEEAGLPAPARELARMHNDKTVEPPDELRGGGAVLKD